MVYLSSKPRFVIKCPPDNRIPTMKITRNRGVRLMTERILVSPVINGTELLRSLALRKVNSFAFRALSPAELAETALIRCGMLPEEKRLRLDEQRVIIGLEPQLAFEKFLVINQLAGMCQTTLFMFGFSSSGSPQQHSNMQSKSKGPHKNIPKVKIFIYK